MPKKRTTVDEPSLDPLTAPAASFVAFNTIQLAHVLGAQAHAALHAELDITLRQFGFIMHLLHNPGAGSRQLARLMGVTAQSAGPLVDDLESRGYVTRNRTAAPGKRMELHLTDAGLQAMNRAKVILAELDAEHRRMLSPHSADILNAALVHLASAIQLGSVSCGPRRPRRNG